MSLGSDQVKAIAHLARININDADVEKTVSSLNNILDLVAQMSDINTDEVQPMAHPMDVSQRLRTDEVLEENQRQRFQAIAPQTEDGLYLVPKVIE